MQVMPRDGSAVGRTRWWSHRRFRRLTDRPRRPAGGCCLTERRARAAVRRRTPRARWSRGGG
jgi:hypothetical protein